MFKESSRIWPCHTPLFPKSHRICWPLLELCNKIYPLVSYGPLPLSVYFNTICYTFTAQMFQNVVTQIWKSVKNGFHCKFLWVMNLAFLFLWFQMAVWFSFGTHVSSRYLSKQNWQKKIVSSESRFRVFAYKSCVKCM